MRKTPLQELDERLEPRSVEISDVVRGLADTETSNACVYSIAVSLKRIADVMEKQKNIVPNGFVLVPVCPKCNKGHAGDCN